LEGRSGGGDDDDDDDNDATPLSICFRKPVCRIRLGFILILYCYPLCLPGGRLFVGPNIKSADMFSTG